MIRVEVNMKKIPEMNMFLALLAIVAIVAIVILGRTSSAQDTVSSEDLHGAAIRALDPILHRNQIPLHPLPDLIGTVEFYPKKVKAKENITLNISITNIGSKGSVITAYSWRVGPFGGGAAFPHNLLPGETYTTQQKVSVVEPGTHEVSLTVDPWGQIKEENETNNYFYAGDLVVTE